MTAFSTEELDGVIASLSRMDRYELFRARRSFFGLLGPRTLRWNASWRALETLEDWELVTRQSGRLTEKGLAIRNRLIALEGKEHG